MFCTRWSLTPENVPLGFHFEQQRTTSLKPAREEEDFVTKLIEVFQRRANLSGGVNEAEAFLIILTSMATDYAFNNSAAQFRRPPKHFRRQLLLSWWKTLLVDGIEKAISWQLEASIWCHDIPIEMMCELIAIYPLKKFHNPIEIVRGWRDWKEEKLFRVERNSSRHRKFHVDDTNWKAKKLPCWEFAVEGCLQRLNPSPAVLFTLFVIQKPRTC